MVGMKRRRDESDDEHAAAGDNDAVIRQSTPNKGPARIVIDGPDDDGDVIEAQTPSRKGRLLHLAENATPRSILKKTGLSNAIIGTPKSTRKLVFETPTKSDKRESPDGTPTLVRNADRSARRKSNRRILERTLNGVESDDEALDEEDILAEQILDDEAEDTEQTDNIVIEEQLPVPETPSKRGRGRPKGSGKGPKKPPTKGTGKVGRPRKQRSPTPPTEIPSHEEYFWQNRPGGTKTSSNTLSTQSLLNHDEYFQAIQSYTDRHGSEMTFLLELHSRAFDQWIFELEEGFNICLYGYGSKRPITERFTAHLYQHLMSRAPYQGTKKTPSIVVVNGYTVGITLKDILTTIASTVIGSAIKLPNQPSTLLELLLNHLSDHPPPHPVPVILNSIDSVYLRRSATTAMLSRLAAHPYINLVCTADTPNFPLLWDVGLKTQYNFLFHDATTFAPYTAEIDTVETVNELLGRSGRRVGGRDGVGFVLRSLPTNARLLFRELVMEQLALSLMDGGDLDDAENLHSTTTSSTRNPAIPKLSLPESTQGVEYRVLYHKAVEAFICTSEVSFRTLLKEFHDHQMIESRKDAMGTERLWVPFSQEELEGLAEDLANEV